MAKYRQKPVVIEAWKLAFPFVDKDEWFNPALMEIRTARSLGIYDNPLDYVARIFTSEGVMVAKEGDYIIRGVRGELYPCEPDIFEELYEQAD